MSKVQVMDHPLIQHKIGIIRRTETSSKEFREMIGEIAMLMCYEATRDLKLEDVEIETPITKMTAKELAGKKLAVVPILRAGLGMVEGMLAIIQFLIQFLTCSRIYRHLMKLLRRIFHIDQNLFLFLRIKHRLQLLNIGRYICLNLTLFFYRLF